MKMIGNQVTRASGTKYLKLFRRESCDIDKQPQQEQETAKTI